MNSSSQKRSATPAVFPKKSRLLKHADFERVYERGHRHFSPSMTVFFMVREAAGGPRVGLTVGKVLGGAVTRNRIKRRVREAVRIFLPLLTGNLDVVINPKKSAATVERSKLEAEIERAFVAVQEGKGVPASETNRRRRPKTKSR